MQESVINDIEKSGKPNRHLFELQKAKQDASWLKRCAFFNAACK